MLPRFYPILDPTRALPVVEQAQAVLDGGASFFQVRHKGAWTRSDLAALETMAKMCPRLIVNDRADIAALVGVGLHVGQTDLPPTDARKQIGPRILGFSTHNAAQLAASAAEPVDYLALGPIFQTASKQNPDPQVGLDNLRAWRPLANRPLVAIGGITRDNAVSVLEAGADSVAVIGDLYPEELTAHSLRERVMDWIKRLS
ncbi:MAG: thiamine phosphate synthase [Acidobacteria bacterium]|nr:thiamine phosphate synthase [Acidobacteriota bacterium]